MAWILIAICGLNLIFGGFDRKEATKHGDDITWNLAYPDWVATAPQCQYWFAYADIGDYHRSADTDR